MKFLAVVLFLSTWYCPATALSEPTKKTLKFAMKRRKTDRRRRRLGPAFKDFPTLWRENDDVYYTEIRIGGVKQQTFSTIVDTGSLTIALPCEQCTNCGSQHRRFVPSSSPTVKDTGNGYQQCYGEGSCNFGRLLTDKVCIGSNCPPSEAATINFGCCNKYAPAFSVQKADGIIGIGHGTTLLKSLNDHHKLISNQFSLCLGREDGIFSIGGVDTSIHKAPVRWTPMTLRSAFYYAKPKKLQVGAEDYSKDVASMPTLPFFDSGTSYSYVPEQVFLILKNFFDQFCAENEGSKCMHDGVEFPPGTDRQDKKTSLSCFKALTPDQKKSFPPIKFIFEGNDFAELVVDPEDYFFPESSTIDCIGIFKDNDYTIGANLMRSHDIVFDVDKKRLGIAPATCDDGIPNKPKPRTQTPQSEKASTPGSYPNNQWVPIGYGILIVVILLNMTFWYKCGYCPRFCYGSKITYISMDSTDGVEMSSTMERFTDDYASEGDDFKTNDNKSVSRQVRLELV